MAITWGDVAKVLGPIAPLLGALIGGPVAPAIGLLISHGLGTENTPDAVLNAIQTSPDTVVKLKQIEADNRRDLQMLTVQAEANRLAAETQVTLSVNATMQAEAVSNHWPTYSWRPFIGFCFGANMVMSTLLVIGVFIAQVASAPGAAKALELLPATLASLAAINALAASILGIASYFRGKMQADPTVPTDNRG